MTREDRSAEKEIKEAMFVLQHFKTVLRDLHPSIQGAVLAQLTAHWVWGHPKKIRKELVESYIKNVGKMMEDYPERRSAKAPARPV